MTVARPVKGICFLLEEFHPVIHGATRQVMLLGPRLVDRGIKVFVVTRRIARNHPKQVEMDGYRICRVPPALGLSRYGKYLMLIPTLLTLIRRRNDYQVLLVSDFKVLGILGVVAAKLLGKKCVLRGSSCGEMDGSYALYFFNSMGAFSRIALNIFLFFRNPILKGTDLFLTNCSAMRRELEAFGIPQNQILVLFNGVDTTSFRPVTESEKQCIRKALKLPAKFIAIYVGRLAKGKGLHTLLDVWERLAISHEKIHLLLVGSGQGYALGCDRELIEAVNTKRLQGKVTFTGNVEKVNRYLQAADCFILPTEYEALSNSLLEAIACGLPCIASKVGGIPDIIRDNVNGILIHPNNQDELLKAIERIIIDKRFANHLGRGARRTAVEKFNIDEKVKVLERVFTSLSE